MPNTGTTFEFSSDSRSKPTGGALIVPLIAKPKPALERLTQVGALCDDAVAEVVEAGALSEEAGRATHTTRRGAYPRILIVSLGAAGKLDGRKIRLAAASAARWLMSEKIKQATLWLDGLLGLDVERAAAEWAMGMQLAGFKFLEYRAPKDPPPARIRVTVQSAQSGHLAPALADMREESRVAEAVNYARRMAHLPPNVLQPQSLAEEARRLAREYRLKCEVMNWPQIEKMKMGGLMAVGRAAEHKPCLIRIDYRGAARSAVTKVLVGKAITFDTGGYNIKTSGMETMKLDKCGGMAVLGILRAAAALKLKCNLVGLIAAAENAISGQAYRPGDILTMASGKTVEVNNTDAEGRLVLADALWYAQERCKPALMIDFATLTGGVLVALGRQAAGLMSNNDELSAQLEESGRRTDERLWRLPLWDDYQELIKGVDSDIKNSAGKRNAHPIVGGMFLKEFVSDDVPWAHLDIAAAACDDNNNATGYGVRLMVDFLRRRGA